MSLMTPETLLKRCNEFRRAGGAEELDELLPGSPSEASACLIARNLNFECTIGNVVSPGEGRISSHDPRLHDVAKALGLEFVRSYRTVVGRRSVMEYHYKLPEGLRRVAAAFDQGKYPDEYYVDAVKESLLSSLSHGP